MLSSQSARELALSDVAEAHAAAIPGLDDIEDLLASGAPPVSVLSSLRSIMAEQMGLETSQDAAGTADLLRWLLKLRTGPFTAAAEALTGFPVRIVTAGEPEDRQLTADEARALGGPGLARLPCWDRTGLMVAETTIVANIRLVLVPGLTGDPEAAALIRKGAPCGAMLPGLARLQRRAVCCWPGDPAVIAAARLFRKGRGFGFSAERITAGLVHRVAGLA